MPCASLSYAARVRLGPAAFTIAFFAVVSPVAAQPSPSGTDAPGATDPHAAPARHDQPPRFEPAWQPKVGFYDFLLTGTGVSLAVAGAVTTPRADHVTDHNAFDEGVRDALRLPRLDDRYEVRDASDVGISLLVTWPFLVDALVTAYYIRGNPDLAKRMAIVSAEVLAVNAGVQGVTNNIVSRERPYGRTCGKQPGLPIDSVDCDDAVRYRSFFSGHASNSFAAASTICVWHAKLGLLGPTGDVLSCVGAYTVAASTALFRVMGDMHYGTDVLTGAAIGTMFGLGIPLLHGQSTDEAPASALRVRVIPVGAGVGIGGAF